MKKLMSLMAMAIVALAFAACGSKTETPESAVEAYVKCFQKGDFAGLKDVVKYDDEAQMDQLIQLYNEKAKSEDYKKNHTIESYEIGEVDMAEDGQSARVHYVLRYSNGKESKERTKVKLIDGQWKVDMGL